MYQSDYKCICCRERQRERKTDRQRERIVSGYIYVSLPMYMFQRKAEREKDRQTERKRERVVSGYICLTTSVYVSEKGRNGPQDAGLPGSQD